MPQRRGVYWLSEKRCPTTYNFRLPIINTSLCYHQRSEEWNWTKCLKALYPAAITATYVNRWVPQFLNYHLHENSLDNIMMSIIARIEERSTNLQG
mmetsp:Transcript_8541/g.18480  ORF Transcript_8541/g.18480 Transcript_8541/m.18480 type:complete len:96 (+) Transcript_8541:486-773(+)